LGGEKASLHLLWREIVTCLFIVTAIGYFSL